MWYSLKCSMDFLNELALVTSKGVSDGKFAVFSNVH